MKVAKGCYSSIVNVATVFEVLIKICFKIQIFCYFGLVQIYTLLVRVINIMCFMYIHITIHHIYATQDSTSPCIVDNSMVCP